MRQSIGPQPQSLLSIRGRTPYLELAFVIGVICSAFTSVIWEYGTIALLWSLFGRLRRWDRPAEVLEASERALPVHPTQGPSAKARHSFPQTITTVQTTWTVASP